VGSAGRLLMLRYRIIWVTLILSLPLSPPVLATSLAPAASPAPSTAESSTPSVRLSLGSVAYPSAAPQQALAGKPAAVGQSLDSSSRS
jgi:hypothetical protein